MTGNEWISQRYTYDDWPEERFIGEHLVVTPKKPPKSKVLNYNLKPENQYFRPPDQGMVWTIDAKLKDTDSDGNLNEPITEAELEFIDEQDYYRDHGQWFYNNGYLEYLTPEHWFYLSYFNIEKVDEKKLPTGEIIKVRGFGLPDFIDADRDHYLLWDQIIRDTRCVGMVEINRRRSGKTFKALSACYNSATSTPHAKVGIQSLEFDKAKGLIRDLVISWNAMPEYFRPLDAGYSQPVNGLNFSAPNKFSGGKRRKIKALNSWIKPFPSTMTKMDGLGITRAYQDEVFKTEDIDVYKRWNILKPALAVGTDVFGKAMLTSTVEEMSSESIAQSKGLWDNSKLTTMSVITGMTKTGLKALFIPAHYGYMGTHPKTGERFIDKFGYSNTESAKDYILAERGNLEGDEYWDWCRKFALSEQEAFRSTVQDSVFIIERVFDQVDYNVTLPEGHVRQGTFVGNMHDGFSFRDSKKGPFKVSMVPDPKDQNLMLPRGNRMIPGNEHLGVFGCDPYDHSGTSNNRFSKAGLHGIDRINPMAPFRSGGVFLEYIYRQANVGLFVNDVVGATVFYGRKVLIENQKQVLIKSLEDFGLHKYMVYTDDMDFTQTQRSRVKPGISTAGGMVRERMMSELDEYIAMYVGRIDEGTQIERFGVKEGDTMNDLYGRFPFNDTLKQITEFDPNDWERFDGVVSLMLAVLELNRKTERFKKSTNKEADVSRKLKSVFRSYDISGNKSEIMR